MAGSGCADPVRAESRSREPALTPPMILRKMRHVVFLATFLPDDMDHTSDMSS